MARNLNTQMVIAMSAMALTAFALMNLGCYLYYAVLYDWLYPGSTATDVWSVSDFAVLGIILAAGQVIAAVLGWRLALAIVRPLKSVAEAARTIASGDFAARAPTLGTPFNEARSLITDFNTMAARLQSAEAELRYSTSAVAHELRTPLTILRGRLQGLRDGVFDGGPALYDQLLSHVEQLGRIVEDLHTLSMSNAGRLELKLADIDLAVEAEAAVSALEGELTGEGMEIERDLGHAVVSADQARVRQILFAVLDNARRYAPRSRVIVQTRRTRDRAVIRCADTGPGLPSGTEHLAFERFWRGEDSRGRVGGGSGLGLSVVRAIARAHGGDARLCDPGDLGLAIEVWFPTPPLT